MAAKPPHAKIDPTARPPRRWPNQASPILNRSRLMPEAAANEPISTNIGITEKL